MHFTTVLIMGFTSTVTVERPRVERRACWLRHLTPTRSALLGVIVNVGLQDHLNDVLTHELVNVDLLRDLLGHFNSLFLDLSAGTSMSLALPRFARPSRQSQLCFIHGDTGSTATLEQPGNTSLCHVHRGSATMMRKFWCGSCSCRVPVVLGGSVSRLGYPRPPALVYRGY